MSTVITDLLQFVVFETGRGAGGYADRGRAGGVTTWWQ